MTKTRQSNIELLRLFSMFLIVWYHMFLFVLEPDNPDLPIFKAAQMPLHVGVPLFVMISGYFGIRFSFKSLGALLSRVYLYVVPATLLMLLPKHPSSKEIFESCLVLGHDGLWFVNTYLCLYIVAPLLKPFDTLTARQRWTILAGLVFMSIYVGDIKMSDPSLIYGKNLLNFIFLYLLGSMLHIYADKIAAIPTKIIVVAYLILSAFTVLSYLYINSSFITIRIWMLSYPYNSPILLISCLLIFSLFCRIKLQSGKVNWIASSVFAIYLIHAVLWNYVEIILRRIENYSSNPIFLIFFSLLLSLSIMALCIGTDKFLNPVWTFISNKTKKVDEWYNDSKS